MYTLNEKVVSRNIETEMKESFSTYALSVIIQRALPDARDGLKPSQRRILIAMRDLNLAPGRKHRKCAKIAGDTSGNYHPHGESVIYPTLVRMAQDFNLRAPLVDGQGNFGSIDGDPPAAMRYTEARLTHLAMELLVDLDKQTVDFMPNYDETMTEPKVLPAKFPNLLCNGCSGIAVGMATNIPPHNLIEVVDAIKLMLDNPKVTIDALMEVLPGPDFPTGANICRTEGIKKLLSTGRGQVLCRAKIGVEPLKGNKEQIVVTEIPYQVNKTNLIENIASLVNNQNIQGVSDLRDESDKDGMRIVVELKRDVIPEPVINLLYKHTELQKTFNGNMLALDQGQPQVMNIAEIIEIYIDHRKEVIIRRTQFELNKAEARAHILEGLKIALSNLDLVVKIVRESKARDEARAALMQKLKLSEIQANAILDMRLYQLTGMEQQKVDAEYKELLKRISYLQSILASEQMVREIIREEVTELAEKHGTPRRTDIVGAPEEMRTEDMIPNEGCIITVSHTGYLKRVPITTFRTQRRGGKGVAGTDTKAEDFVEHLFTASAHDYILFFTIRGRCYWKKVYELPQFGRTARGRALPNVLGIPMEEKVTAMIRVREFEDDKNLIMATRHGIVKKTSLTAYSNPRKTGIQAIKLDEKDELISVKMTTGHDEIVLAARNGLSIRFKEDDVRQMGRVTRGVKGITLAKGDFLIGMAIVDDHASLLVACENGYGKRTEFKDYRVQKRGGKGIITIKTTERNGPVVGALSVRDQDQIMLISQEGKMVRMAVSDFRTIGRNTQGVRLIGLEEQGLLSTVAKVITDQNSKDETPDLNGLGDLEKIEDTE
jgi:DNA gyrase subunit A